MRYFLVVIVVLLSPAALSIGGLNPVQPVPSVLLDDGKAYQGNQYSSVCVKCHTRAPRRSALDNTALGSHFVNASGKTTNHKEANEKIDVWDISSAPIYSGGISRYGQVGGIVSVTGQAGEMICESCHSLKNNVGTFKLLAFDNVASDFSYLCRGCHGPTAGGHHPLTGETVSTTGQPLNNSASSYIRNPPAFPAISQVTYPGPDKLNCRSCHIPHQAQTSTGARILKRGYRFGSGPDDLNRGKAVTGIGDNSNLIIRQYDVTAPNRLVTDFTPLCDCCHQAGGD